MTAGHDAKYTIPKCLKAGYYLVRHEIIALHVSIYLSYACLKQLTIRSRPIRTLVLSSTPDAISSKLLDRELRL
jgi:hypothetical protein